MRAMEIDDSICHQEEYTEACLLEETFPLPEEWFYNYVDPWEVDKVHQRPHKVDQARLYLVEDGKRSIQFK